MTGPQYKQTPTIDKPTRSPHQALPKVLDGSDNGKDCANEAIEAALLCGEAHDKINGASPLSGEEWRGESPQMSVTATSEQDSLHLGY